jgi:hypothetical protein
MEYFGFESADWHEFEDADTLFIGGAITLVCDWHDALRGAADTVDEIAVTFDFRAFMPESPCRSDADVFDIYFAPGTFPLPNGYTKADAEEMILDNFSISAEPGRLGTRIAARLP